jgi:hypothetical protein
LPHAIGIPITTEAKDDQSLVLGHDRLVDMPAGNKMGEDDGTHGVRFLGGETVMERCVVDVGRQRSCTDSMLSVKKKKRVHEVDIHLS